MSEAGQANEQESSQRDRQIQRVLDDCVKRRGAGEDLPDEAVIAAHPDLMPELAERLRALRLIEEAARRADRLDAPAPGKADALEGLCPFCRTRVHVKAEHAGRRMRCKCGRVFVADLSSSGDGTFASPPPPPELRSAIPGYEIERELGTGGMGRVYLARELSTKRQVALKVMLAGPRAGARQRRRFEREVEIAASLEHPNIARLYASGLHEGRLWFAMEYVEGRRLDEHAVQRRLGVREILALFVRVCNGVNHAHQQGVMHRDLKPANILVDARGQPRILDFGLAKLTGGGVDVQATISMPGEIAGTPAYMSPEQVERGTIPLDIRSDVYSLGVILYELLTGQSPYGKPEGLTDLLRAIVAGEPEPPRRLRKGIPDEVNSIVLKALEKHRTARYQSAGEMGRDISYHLAGDPVSAKQGSGWYMLRKTAARYRGWAITAAVAVALSLGFGLLFATLYTKTRIELRDVIHEKEVYRDRPVGPEAPVSTPVPSPAATPAPVPKAASPWVRIFDGETLSGWSEPRGGSGTARVNNGAIEVTGYELINTAIYHQMEASDMAISAQVKKVAGDHGSMYLRHGPKGVYLAVFKGGGEPGDFRICKWHPGGGGWPELAVNKTPITLIDSEGRPGNEGFFEMTFRAVGTRLTVEVQGREILRAEDADIDYGSPGIGGTALFRDIYVWVPDKQGAAGSGQPGAGAPAPPLPPGSAADMKNVIWWLDQACDDADRISTDLGRAEAHFWIARTCARAGDVARARLALHACGGFLAKSAAGYGAYAHIAAAQAKAGDEAGAQRTLDEVKAAIYALPDQKAKDEAFTRFSDELIWADFLPGAKTVASEIAGDVGLRAVQYLDIARYEAKVGDVAGAGQTVRTLTAVVAAVADPTRKASLYWSLADVQLKTGDLRGARQSLDVAKAANLTEGNSWVRGDIARLYAKIGDLGQAKALAATIEHHGRRARAYTLIAEVQRKAGDVAGATQTLGLAKALAAATADAKEKAWMYADIARWQALCGNAAGARETVQVALAAVPAVADAKQRGEAYGGIALAQADAGDLDGVRATMRLIRPIVESVGYRDGMVPSSVICRQAEKGDTAGAKETTSLIPRATKSADVAAWYVAAAQAKAGDYNGARATAEAIASVEWRDRAYRAVAEGQARRGDLTTLRAWVDSLTDPAVRAYACVGAAEGLLPPPKIVGLGMWD